jgi:hypothetical protein
MSVTELQRAQGDPRAGEAERVEDLKLMKSAEELYAEEEERERARVLLAEWAGDLLKRARASLGPSVRVAAETWATGGGCGVSGFAGICAKA